jgi:hypothetical protein
VVDRYKIGSLISKSSHLVSYTCLDMVDSQPTEWALLIRIVGLRSL